MLEPPIPPPYDRRMEGQHPWEKPAIYAANCALGFFLIVFVVFTILGALPDKTLQPAPAKKKAARSKDGKYTKEEVAKHNTPEDAWLILDGKVYDVTEYVDEHPGGAALLKHVGWALYTGSGPPHPPVLLRKWPENGPPTVSTASLWGDSTKGFHGPQHPTRVFEMVDEYLVGTLIETDKDK